MSGPILDIARIKYSYSFLSGAGPNAHCHCSKKWESTMSYQAADGSRPLMENLQLKKEKFWKS